MFVLFAVGHEYELVLLRIGSTSFAKSHKRP
nr:MAG TPA: hypothetical protein [Caudoviricetes sp.]